MRAGRAWSNTRTRCWIDTGGAELSSVAAEIEQSEQLRRNRPSDFLSACVSGQPRSACRSPTSRQGASTARSRPCGRAGVRRDVRVAVEMDDTIIRATRDCRPGGCSRDEVVSRFAYRLRRRWIKLASGIGVGDRRRATRGRSLMTWDHVLPTSMSAPSWCSSGSTSRPRQPSSTPRRGPVVDHLQGHDPARAAARDLRIPPRSA